MSKQNIMHIPHPYLWGLTDGHLFTHYSGISSHSQGSSYKVEDDQDEEDKEAVKKKNHGGQTGLKMKQKKHNLVNTKKTSMITKSKVRVKQLRKPVVCLIPPLNSKTVMKMLLFSIPSVEIVSRRKLPRMRSYQ